MNFPFPIKKYFVFIAINKLVITKLNLLVKVIFYSFQLLK